ncbi:hypothetical protein DENSPDRAFT_832760 [Dentipellis sp. KUC8613]|nr:hypothetical protein DENSPDRAFT_832760 [Dentipellis sp. KUC8613]
MTQWTIGHAPPEMKPYILEVGSGNGTLLFSLLDAGYEPSRLAGVDYSPDAVKLARLIATSRGGEEISFAECNFLFDVPLPVDQQESSIGGWNIVLDKGTYDAIALAEKDEVGRSPVEGYPGRVAQLLKKGGHFLITSCNFTEEELRASFATEETGMVYHSRVPHKTYSFGGQSGSEYATVAFQKVT